jgi:uncharacterized protein (DUF1330 family)
MPAYLVAQIEWHNPEIQKEYRAKLGATLEKYGGRTLFAGEPNVLEGSWKPPRAVLLEFPTMEALRSWYGSVEYAPLIEIRNRGAHTNIIAFEAPAV